MCQINDDIIEEHLSYNDKHEEGYSSASEEEVRECTSQKLERVALFADETGGKLDAFIFSRWGHRGAPSDFQKIVIVHEFIQFP